MTVFPQRKASSIIPIQQISRRAALVGAAGAALLGRQAEAETNGFFTRHPPGLQLFSVLSPLERDFSGTLRTVAEIGYKEVETIGAFDRPPAWVAGELRRCGLSSPSQHLVPGHTYKIFDALTAKRITLQQLVSVYLQVFDPDRIVPVIEEGISRGKALGQKYIVWPIMFEQQIADRIILDRFIKAFNIAGDMCAREDMVFAYHNHSREFVRIGTDVVFDIILNNTDKNKVKFELDYFWMRKGGVDPLDYLAAYPGRFKLMHLKDRDSNGDIVDIGLGNFDFPAIVAAADKSGVEHFFVERDDPSSDPLSNVRTSLKNLLCMT